MQQSYLISAHSDNATVTQEIILQSGDMREGVMRRVANVAAIEFDAAIKQALIKQGWVPPADKPFVVHPGHKQWCAANDRSGQGLNDCDCKDHENRN